VSTLITTISLLSYALVNLACFAASISRAPGWRPSFRFYHPLWSLFGTALCITFMFLVLTEDDPGRVVLLQ
jgi:hypothetical protein